jgi:5-methylcytosine-specific restriction endonuclease McrA
VTHDRYRTSAWRSVRRTVLIRDGYLCQLKIAKRCRGTANSVDHRIRPEDGGSVYDPNNLVSCCVPCNTAKRNQQIAKRAKQSFRTSREW